jgi:undecaprenyl-diphosphatase
MHMMLLDGILYYNTILFYMINVGMDNSVFDFIMPIITNFGNLFAWSLVCWMIFIFEGEKGKKVAILGFGALFLSSVVVIILKYVVAEPRPFLVLNNVDLLSIENDYSFTSGHVAASFAAAVIIGKKYNFKFKGKKHKLIYPLLTFAAFVGFSRVYIGVHYPLDVVFGAIVGTIFALIVLKLEDKIFLNKISNYIVYRKSLRFKSYRKD